MADNDARVRRLDRCGRKVEAEHEHDVREHKHRATVVVRSRFDVRVRQQEDGEDDRDHVPAREDQPAVSCGSKVTNSRESINVVAHLGRVVHRTKGNHGGDLEQTDLQSVRGTDLHTERNVAVHRERDGVHELGRVGDEREERQAEEFLIDATALQDNVDDIDEDFCGQFGYLGKGRKNLPAIPA